MSVFMRSLMRRSLWTRMVTHAMYSTGRSSNNHCDPIGHKTGANMKYLSQQEAQEIDVELMDVEKQGFSVDQLMELAGMSVAHAAWCLLTDSNAGGSDTQHKVLCVVGPGNNGGDALVAARHLKHFGAQVDLWLPKPASIEKKELYRRLLVQCEKTGVSRALNQMDMDDKAFADGIRSRQYSLIIDGIFGFSFDPSSGIRSPFDRVIDALVTLQDEVPILSIDIPSGWHVEDGYKGIERKTLRPRHLISLTAPKRCAQCFQGESHWLGGRFVPDELNQRYDLRLPSYEGVAIVQRLPVESGKE